MFYVQENILFMQRKYEVNLWIISGEQNMFFIKDLSCAKWPMLHLIPLTHMGGGSHIDIVSLYIGSPFFTKFGIVITGFSSEMKEPKLHILGVF